MVAPYCVCCVFWLDSEELKSKVLSFVFAWARLKKSKEMLVTREREREVLEIFRQIHLQIPFKRDLSLFLLFVCFSKQKTSADTSI